MSPVPTCCSIGHRRSGNSVNFTSASRHRSLMSLALAALAAGSACSARAAVVFSEDFNNPAFAADPGFLGTTDRWASVTYSGITNANSWVFTGNRPYYVRNNAAPDGALLLNEPSAEAARVITGFVPGQTYSFDFLLSGDNKPSGRYQFLIDINGVNVFSAFGVDGLPGTNPGTPYSITFIAAGNTASVRLYQHDLGTGASPVIDNITISDAVPEPSTWGMMLLGLGALGTALRSARRKRRLRTSHCGNSLRILGLG